MFALSRSAAKAGVQGVRIARPIWAPAFAVDHRLRLCQPAPPPGLIRRDAIEIAAHARYPPSGVHAPRGTQTCKRPRTKSGAF